MYVNMYICVHAPTLEVAALTVFIIWLQATVIAFHTK
jgi:hypothetical protein